MPCHLIEEYLDLGPFSLDAPRPLERSFVPHNLMPSQGSPVPLAKFQMAPGLRLLASSGSKSEEPRYACLSEVKASYSHKMWTEVSSSVADVLPKGLLVSPLSEDVFSVCYVR